MKCLECLGCNAELGSGAQAVETIPVQRLQEEAMKRVFEGREHTAPGLNHYRNFRRYAAVDGNFA